MILLVTFSISHFLINLKSCNRDWNIISLKVESEPKITEYNEKEKNILNKMLQKLSKSD